MTAGTYAILRFIADPWRDEPINIGVIIAGAAGALLRLDAAAIKRMKDVDPCLDPAILDDLRTYLDGVLSEPVWRVRGGRVERIAPDEPGYLSALAEQMPRRFALGRVLDTTLADARREMQERTAAELLHLLVTPAPAKTATGI